jgi:hypothetical protein
MIFKIVASRGASIIFDRQIEASSPREARKLLKRELGLESLSGVVYAITEIPVELIAQIVSEKIAEVIVERRGGAMIWLPELVRSTIRSFAENEVAALTRRVEQLEESLSKGNKSPNGHLGGEVGRLNPLDHSSPPSSTTPPCSNELPRGIPEPLRAIFGPDWTAIREFYERTRSIKQTAAAFDVSPNTLKSRVRREGWGR